MRKTPFALALALSVAVSGTVEAQRAGSIELGGFGAYHKFDSDYGTDDAFGFGGRAGLWIFRNLAVEGDISFASIDNAVGGADTFRPVYARLTYNLPLSERIQLLVGAGYVNAGYIGDTTSNEYEDGANGLVGLRFNLNPNWSLRFDGLVDYFPSPAAQLTDSVGTHLTLRAGLSYQWKRRRCADGTAAGHGRSGARPGSRARTGARPAPPPVNQDSIDAANRARNTMQMPILFDFDRFNIRPDAAAALEQKLPIFQANPNMRIRIEGHTDPRGSDEYNLALGERRADAARRWLVQRGIAESRIEITSAGEERLVCTETTEECYQRNRRDEFVIIAGGENIRGPQD